MPRDVALPPPSVTRSQRGGGDTGGGVETPDAPRTKSASMWSIATAPHGTRSSARGASCRWPPPSGALTVPSRVTRGTGGRHGRGCSTASGLDDRGGGTGGADGPRVLAHGRWGAAWAAVAGTRCRQQTAKHPCRRHRRATHGQRSLVQAQKITPNNTGDPKHKPPPVAANQRAAAARGCQHEGRTAADNGSRAAADGPHRGKQDHGPRRGAPGARASTGSRH